VQSDDDHYRAAIDPDYEVMRREIDIFSTTKVLALDFGDGFSQ
jgi:hypothetical protein